MKCIAYTGDSIRTEQGERFEYPFLETLTSNSLLRITPSLSVILKISWIILKLILNHRKFNP